MLATTGNPAAGLKTLLDAGDHFPQAFAGAQGQRQRGRIALDGLGGLRQAPIRKLPATEHQEPMLHQQRQHFGVEFTQLSPGLGAAGLIEPPQALPEFEKQFDLPARAHQDQRLLERQEFDGTLVTSSVQSARARCRWLSVWPLRLACLRRRRRRCWATWAGTRTARSRALKRSCAPKRIGRSWERPALAQPEEQVQAGPGLVKTWVCRWSRDSQ